AGPEHHVLFRRARDGHRTGASREHHVVVTAYAFRRHPADAYFDGVGIGLSPHHGEVVGPIAHVHTRAARSADGQIIGNALPFAGHQLREHAFARTPRHQKHRLVRRNAHVALRKPRLDHGDLRTHTATGLVQELRINVLVRRIARVGPRRERYRLAITDHTSGNGGSARWHGIPVRKPHELVHSCQIAPVAILVDAVNDNLVATGTYGRIEVVAVTAPGPTRDTIAIDVDEIGAGAILIDAVVRYLVGARKNVGVLVVAVGSQVARKAVSILVAVPRRGIAIVVDTVVVNLVALGADVGIEVVAIAFRGRHAIAVAIQLVAGLIGAAAVLVDAVAAHLDRSRMHVGPAVVAILCTAGGAGGAAFAVASGLASVETALVRVRQIAARAILRDAVVRYLVGAWKHVGVVVRAVERRGPAIPVSISATRCGGFVVAAAAEKRTHCQGP